MKILITGSGGLVGSEASLWYCSNGHTVTGLDNNGRKDYFGSSGDVSGNIRHLKSFNNYTHINIDITNRQEIEKLFLTNNFDAVIHCAAQPSHDKSREIPYVDVNVNINGTINILESIRLYNPESIFVFLSTNKVYGDTPNSLQLIETETRYEVTDSFYFGGINESMSIDQSTHSVFGASKLSADIMTQEYGRYFGIRTACFRCGCIAGPLQKGVELQGFLSHAVNTVVNGNNFKIFGHKGKQVRDFIHSIDVINAIDAFIANPAPSKVYNIGGGRNNSASVMEVFSIIDDISGYKCKTDYISNSRVGDHIWYISDTTRFQKDYTNWEITISLKQIIESILESHTKHQCRLVT